MDILPVPASLLEEFCRQRHIRRLAVFGSAIRGDMAPDSDIDLLVEFEPGHVPGLDFFAMERELSAMLRRRADLNTLEWLSPLLRQAVSREARIVYDAT